ncbi:MAG: hypothetical protein E7418_03105 [Ruminococcaceae bacterium]|nr:hypothetical protein [Oscillospiraceae bacterium]
MEKILADLKKTMNTAVKKSGELLEVTKLKMAIAGTQNEVQAEFVKLGELVYLMAKSDDKPSEDAEEIIAHIDTLKEKISELEANVAELTAKKICASCGKICEETAGFCSACGAKFEA